MEFFGAVGLGNQLIDRSINQSINQSFNQSASQSVGRSVSQSVNQQPINQSINQSIVGHSINQSIDWSINRSAKPFIMLASQEETKTGSVENISVRVQTCPMPTTHEHPTIPFN